MFDENGWTYETFSNLAVDTPVALGIRCLSDEVAAHVTIAATTGDMTFEQGASTAAAAVGTGDNPGSSGVIDLTNFTSLIAVVNEINSTDDWEAWLGDLPGDYLTNISAGNGIFTVGGLADQDCTGESGFEVVVDTSLKTAEDFGLGITLNRSSLNIRHADVQVEWQILKIVANVTFGGATDGIYVYECDDRLGTKVQKDKLALASATGTTFGDGSYVLYQTKGKTLRLLAKDASGAITSPSLTAVARWRPLGPVINRRKMYSYLGG